MFFCFMATRHSKAKQFYEEDSCVCDCLNVTARSVRIDGNEFVDRVHDIRSRIARSLLGLRGETLVITSRRRGHDSTESIAISEPSSWLVP
jgi:hypothetical protein